MLRRANGHRLLSVMGALNQRLYFVLNLTCTGTLTGFSATKSTFLPVPVLKTTSVGFFTTLCASNSTFFILITPLVVASTIKLSTYVHPHSTRSNGEKSDFNSSSSRFNSHRDPHLRVAAHRSTRAQNRTKLLARGVELLRKAEFSCRLETAPMSRGPSQSS